jgi:pimeloyl-ACP methyl ester carboxylesterase
MPVLNIAGADIYYEVAGKGRPSIVFIHGGMCDHRDWTMLTERLAAHHTVVTLDLRAHGKSSGDPGDCSAERWAEDINALIAALDLAPAVLVGHSMGSRIAAEAIVQKPENAAALVLLDGSRAYADAAASPTTAPPLRSQVDIITSTIGPYASDEVRSQIMATMTSVPPGTMTACMRAMIYWDTHRAETVFSELPRTLPVLAIQSTYHDRATPRYGLKSENETTPYLDFLRRTVPQVETKILTRTGHFSMMERPDDVAMLLRDFANRSKR